MIRFGFLINKRVVNPSNLTTLFLYYSLRYIFLYYLLLALKPHITKFRELIFLINSSIKEYNFCMLFQVALSVKYALPITACV